MKNLYQQHRSIQPWLQRNNQQDIDSLRKPEQDPPSHVNGYKKESIDDCNLCACCSTSCSTELCKGDRYLGPAVLLQAYRWITDNRDTQSGERLQRLRDPAVINRCNPLMFCNIDCPKGLNPGDAISEIKKLIKPRTRGKSHVPTMKFYD